MNKVIIFFIALCLCQFAQAASNHAVRGYIKKNGTYVAPTRKTNPNRTQTDNWSSKPNVNPYTGKSGSKEPKK